MIVVNHSEAIKLNPKYANTYKYRGISYEKLGEDQKAKADRAKAEELE